MNKTPKHSSQRWVTRNNFAFLWLLLALAACGPTRHTTRPAPPTEVTSFTLAESLWTFSLTHPEGFTLNINNWEEPKEGIAVAYSATQNRHDRADLDFVVSHAQSHEGYVGGWLDTVSGRYYFDSVRLFSEDSLVQAIKFGRKNAQSYNNILTNPKQK